MSVDNTKAEPAHIWKNLNADKKYCFIQLQILALHSLGHVYLTWGESHISTGGVVSTSLHICAFRVAILWRYCCFGI